MPTLDREELKSYLRDEREDIRLRYNLAFDTERWRVQLPYLRFDPDWEVKVIPPVLGAVIRFLVRKGDREISVYFDAYRMLGACQDYWEIYPLNTDDAGTQRFSLGEENEMLQAIRDILDGKKEQKNAGTEA